MTSSDSGSPLSRSNSFTEADVDAVIAQRSLIIFAVLAPLICLVHFIASSIAISVDIWVLLASPISHKCNTTAFAEWVYAHLAEQFINIVSPILFHYAERRHINQKAIAICYNVLFLFSIVILVWSVVLVAIGRNENCMEVAPRLYTLVLAWMVIKILTFACWKVCFSRLTTIIFVTPCLWALSGLVVAYIPSDLFSDINPASDDVILALHTSPYSSPLAYEISTCRVCLEDFEQDSIVKHLPCDHGYHEECIDSWLRLSRLCPVCRHPVDEDDEPAEPAEPAGSDSEVGSEVGSE